MKMNFKHGEIITVTMVIWENNTVKITLYLPVDYLCHILSFCYGLSLYKCLQNFDKFNIFFSFK